MRQPAVRHAMRANGRERMAAEPDHVAPVHEKPVRERLAVDARAEREVADRLQKLRFGPAAQQPVDPVECGRFLGRRPRGDARPPDVDGVEATDRLLELEPPQARRAFDEPGRTIDREGRAAAFKHRQRFVQRVAIAVVEGQRGEGRALRLDEPAARLAERHELEAFAPDDVQRQVEELRRDLQRAVRRIAGRRTLRPHAVERQNDAAAAREGAGRAVQAAGVKACETCADDRVLDRHGLPSRTMNPRSLRKVDGRSRRGKATPIAAARPWGNYASTRRRDRRVRASDAVAVRVNDTITDGTRLN